MVSQGLLYENVVHGAPKQNVWNIDMEMSGKFHGEALFFFLALDARNDSLARINSHSK